MTQQDLPLPRPRGGARPGAGRPKIKGRRASEPHKVRSKVDPRKPLHVVLRAVRGLRLRKKGVYHAIREALAKTKWVRIIHMSIQQSHVHLIVEAQHAANLARGMKSFQIMATAGSIPARTPPTARAPRTRTMRATHTVARVRTTPRTPRSSNAASSRTP